MSHMMVGNLDPDTTDEELRDFLVKYGFPAFDEIVRVPGDGTHPAAAVTFEQLDPETLRKLQPRIHHMYWKGRELTVSILADRYT